MTGLTTARLHLTRSIPTDCPDFVALEQDPEVMRFLNGGVPVDRATAAPGANFLMPDGTEPHVWTARRHDDSFVGWFCLWPDGAGGAELGYRLRRADWGQGLAAEGAAALVAWGFATCGYAQILACTMAVNLGSRRVMEKIGMSCLRTDHPLWPEPFPGTAEGEVWYRVMRPHPLP